MKRHDPEFTRRDRLVGWLYGGACSLLFAAAVLSMMLALGDGLRAGVLRLHGSGRLLLNGFLILQFGPIHSFLQTRRGRALLARLAPSRLTRHLGLSVFTTLASVQLLAVFLLWSPSGAVWWQPSGFLAGAWYAGYLLSWVLLLKAMWDAGLDVQTGFRGWGRVALGWQPGRRGFPRRGLFQFVRQPVYVAFCLTLWTGPVWDADHLALALVWTAYCLGGPLLKERRYEQSFGEEFLAYKRAVPYWIPRLRVGRGAGASLSSRIRT